MALVLNPGQQRAQAMLTGLATHQMLYGGSRSGKTFLHCRNIVARAIKAPKSRHAALRFRFNAAKESIALDTFPAVMAKAEDSILVTFTRAGWSNPVGLQRPAEQRVRYRFFEGSLVRDYWTTVDPALTVEPRQRVLITRVKSVELRFLDPASRNWRTDWPVAAPSGQVNPLQIDNTLLVRPLAIELTVELEDWGRVQRVFEIPT